MSAHSISSGRLSADIDSLGAQLRSLRFNGVEYLWDAREAWGYSAPVLFPIISGLPDSVLRHNGERYSIPSHGFARRVEWTPVGASSFELLSSNESRAQYPFEFQLTAEYLLSDRLTVVHAVTNRGDEPMPFLLGAHPAFQWPLPGSAPGTEHEVYWAHGGDTMRQAVHGLRPGRILSPAANGRLVLDRSQFAEDAMLFDDIEPREVSYTAAGAARITLSYPDYPRLGVWSKPLSGDFVCLEPWSGYPATADFDGDILELPEATIVEPGHTREFRYSITITAD